MADLPGIHLRPGTPVQIQFANGGELGGTVERLRGSWMLVRSSHGLHLVNLELVAMCGVPELRGGDDVVDDDEALPRPRSAEAPVRAGGRAPGRPWRDEDLKSLAEAFLDGVQDAECSERFARTRAAIRELRAGFECARGNLVDDQISPVARTWIERWRRVLAG